MSDALEPLLADGVIEAVLGQLKSGKEAEVWLVEHQGQVVAAKVYKERHQRNFANNAGYREGRDVRNSRTRRAMAKGSRFGQAAAEEAWKSAEADTLYKLHALGVRVPTPVMFYEGILLMELVVDAQGSAAPRMVEAPPSSPEEARAWYLDLRQQVVAMLSADLIHGDLSAYNILISYAGPVVIDFPQTIAAARNNNAERYFRRDLDNVRTFLEGYDPGLRAFFGDTQSIWNAYVKRELTPDWTPPAPSGRAPPPPPTSARPLPTAQPARAPRVSAAAPELDPLEAELRALEAQVLRQGGGARPKPPKKQELPQGRGRRGPGRGPGGGFGQGRPSGSRPGGGAPSQQAQRGPGAGQGQRGGPAQAHGNGQRPQGQHGQQGQQQRGGPAQTQGNGQRPQGQHGQQQRGGPAQAQGNGQRPQGQHRQQGQQGQQQRGGHAQAQGNGQRPQGQRRQQGQQQRGGHAQAQGNGQRQSSANGSGQSAGQQRPRHDRPSGGGGQRTGRGQQQRPRPGPEVSYVTRPNGGQR